MAYLSANGLRHHVQVLGDGPETVVFLHGLVMDNLSSWYFTAGAKAAARHRVVLYDLRGHGRTERPPTHYRPRDFVDDLAHLLSALRIDTPVSLVGNSLGGQIALMAALTHPELVRDLALVDAHLGQHGWGETMADTLSLRGEDADAAISTHFASWLGRHSNRKRTRLAETARALVLDTSLVADLRGGEPLTDDHLRQLPHPVLALYGERSDLLHHARHAVEQLPDATLRVFGGTGHSLLWERTDDVVHTLLTWLNR